METNAREYEQKIQDAYNELDKSHVRKLMKRTYLCAAKCCESNETSYDDVQRCIDNCTTPLNNAQTYLKNEFQDFQSRVQRCLMVCNDTVKAKMEVNKIKILSDKYKNDYEECAKSCLKTHSELLPSIVIKIKSTLEEHDANIN